jgi:hypothetical protein
LLLKNCPQGISDQMSALVIGPDGGSRARVGRVEAGGQQRHREEEEAGAGSINTFAFVICSFYNCNFVFT